MTSSNFVKCALAFVFIGVFIIVVWLFQAHNDMEQLHEAYQKYVAGERASTIAERQKEFNAALSIYTQMETAHTPTFSNGKLYYNIGNTYFQLEQYPWAILYYSKAQSLMPRNDSVRHNLEVAQSKLGIVLEKSNSIFSNYLSFPEKLQMCFALALFLLAVISLNVWYPSRLLKYAICIVAMASIVLLGNLVYSFYLAPINGIIVRATTLYRDAGEQYAKAVDKPVMPGSKVQVIDVLHKGTWLKIITPEGNLGFIPNTSIRMIGVS